MLDNRLDATTDHGCYLVGEVEAKALTGDYFLAPPEFAARRRRPLRAGTIAPRRNETSAQLSSRVNAHSESRADHDA